MSLAACGPTTQETPAPRQQTGSASTTPLFSQEEISRWQSQAQNVSILRDRWGIAHIYGRTDADTVFGTLYAQAEDDFNRVETNYINALGRLAEAEGSDQIYRDLRMKLFIDPADIQAQYEAGPR